MMINITRRLQHCTINRPIIIRQHIIARSNACQLQKTLTIRPFTTVADQLDTNQTSQTIIPEQKTTVNEQTKTYVKGAKLTPQKMKRFTQDEFDEALSNTKDFATAKSLVNEMHRNGFTPSVKQYTVLVERAIRLKKTNFMEYWLRDMKHNKVMPNEVTFTVIIGYYCSIEDAKAVKKWTEGMSLAGAKPTMITYGLLIKFHTHMKDGVMVDETLKQMKADGLRPNVPIYTRLISFYTHQNREKGIKTLEELRATPLKMDMTAHNAAVKLYAKGLDSDNVKRWLQIMKDEGVMPTVHTLKMIVKYIKDEDFTPYFEHLSEKAHVTPSAE